MQNVDSQFKTVLEARKNLNVKRFHTKPMLVGETVGHHSSGVAFLIMTIDPDCSAKLLKAAILHDMGEYMTGDIPAPGKRASKLLASAENIMASMYCKEHNLSLPQLNDREKWLLKLCDGLDLVFKCAEEISMGNLCATVIMTNIQGYLRMQLEGRQCELATYILEHYRDYCK